MEKGLIRRTTFIDVSFILVLSLLSLTWFRGDNIINIGDFCFPLSRKIYLNVSMFAWDHSISMGYFSPGQLASIFAYSLIGIVTDSLGFSLVFFQKAMFYIWFSTSGLGMYYLCRVTKLSRAAAVFAALFYMMNPYSLLVPWHLASGLLIAGYSMTPLLLALLIRMFETQRMSDFALLLFVWFVMGTYSYMNPAVGVVHLIIFGGYSLFCLVDRRMKREPIGRSFLLASLLVTAWVAMSSYWIVPFLMNIVDQTVSAGDKSMGFISNFETFKLNSAKIVDAFRLHGLWAMYGKWRPQTPYYAWADVFKNWGFILLSYIPTIFVCISLTNLRTRLDKNKLFFVLMFIGGLFFVKGAYPPFEAINLWIVNHLPFFGTAFRAGFHKWGLLFSLAFAWLFGLGVETVFDWMFKKKVSPRWIGIGGGAVAAVIFGVYMFPFWNGQVIFSGGGIIPGARTTVPATYDQFFQWTRKQPGEFRIFSLPLSRNSNALYHWQNSGYSGADFIRFFSDKPVIYANYGHHYEIPLLIAEKIEAGDNSGLFPLYSLLNVKYLIMHEDINWEATKGHGWWVNRDETALRRYLVDTKGLSVEKEFEYLKVYRIPEKYLTPLIYTARTPVVINGTHEDLADVAAKHFLDERPMMFMLKDGIGSAGLPVSAYSGLEKRSDNWVRTGTAVPSSLPHINFRKVNSAKYEISVFGAKDPFWLVFGDTFNKGWHLFKGKNGIESGPHEVAHPDFKVEEMRHTSVPDFSDIRFFFKQELSTDHFVANGYANAWYVDPAKKGLGDDFSLEVFFMPQSVVYLGLVGAILLVVLCLIIMVRPLGQFFPILGTRKMLGKKEQGICFE